MPTEIDLGMPPAGYCVKSARKNEVDALIQFMEFTSTEDGQHFVRRLEGIPDRILRELSPQVLPSQIDTMLAICRRDGKATVYVNEVVPKARVRVSRPLEKGARVMKSDIVDVDRLDLNVQIPNDAGFLFLFSVHWRKGLFYDFGPAAGPVPEARQYDVATVLGQAYCHVMFQERFSISDTEWNTLFAAKWFPFAGLRHETIDDLISYVRSGWEPDEKNDDIVAEVKGRAMEMLAGWRKHSSFAPHIEILERAVERFQNDDWVSCTGLLFPRIEGILRTHHTSLNTGKKPKTENLTESAVSAKLENNKCMLLPHRFSEYLNDVYFANFNPAAQNIDVSRHSVAHGVATPSEFNRKSALIAILVVHQLFYFLRNQHECQNSKSSDAKPEIQ